MFGWYPSSCTACLTRAIVSALIPGLPLRTAEIVCLDTPTRKATSRIVTGICCSPFWYMIGNMIDHVKSMPDKNGSVKGNHCKFSAANEYKKGTVNLFV